MDNTATPSNAKQPSARGQLTLLYTGAALTTFLGAFSIVALVGKLFSMWTGGSTIQNMMSALVTGNSAYVDTIFLAIIGVGMTLAAFFLYGKVSREIAGQPEYTKTSAYAFITNALVGVFFLTVGVMALELVSILISSLVLIGTNTDIGAMYLSMFLPLLLSGAVVAFVGWMALEIMRGRDKSKLLTIVLMSVAGALLVATLITVPIKAHGSSSGGSNYDSIRQYLDY